MWCTWLKRGRLDGGDEWQLSSLMIRGSTFLTYSYLFIRPYELRKIMFVFARFYFSNLASCCANGCSCIHAHVASVETHTA